MSIFYLKFLFEFWSNQIMPVKYGGPFSPRRNSRNSVTKNNDEETYLYQKKSFAGLKGIFKGS